MTTKLTELTKKATKDLENTQLKIRALENKIVYEGAPALAKLVRDSEPQENGAPNENDPIQAMNTEINLTKAVVNRLQNNLNAIDIPEIKNNIQKSLDTAKAELVVLEKAKGPNTAAIHEGISDFKKQIEILNKQKEEQKAVLQVYQDVKKAKPKKIVSSKDPNANVNHAAKEKFKELAEISNFSPREQLLIRNAFVNPDDPKKDDPFRWDNAEFEQRLGAAL